MLPAIPTSYNNAWNCVVKVTAPKFVLPASVFNSALSSPLDAVLTLAAWGVIRWTEN
jgi:hypothetical protein